jgi:hypothetical protein
MVTKYAALFGVLVLVACGASSSHSASSSGDQLNSSEATPFAGQFVQQADGLVPGVTQPASLQITPETYYLSSPDLKVQFVVDAMNEDGTPSSPTTVDLTFQYAGSGNAQFTYVDGDCQMSLTGSPPDPGGYQIVDVEETSDCQFGDPKDGGLVHLQALAGRYQRQ